MKPKVFRSRVSILLLIFMVVVVVLPLAVPMIVVNQRDWTMLVPVSVWAFVFGSLFGCRYIVSDEKLLVRCCGIPFVSIAIADIYSVERTYSPQAAPLLSAAASLKQLAVYKRRANGYLKVITLVSPTGEQEFLDTLKAINPSIQIQVTDKKGRWRFWDWEIM
jgi:hypothetical protein